MEIIAVIKTNGTPLIAFTNLKAAMYYAQHQVDGTTRIEIELIVLDVTPWETHLLVTVDSNVWTYISSEAAEPSRRPRLCVELRTEFFKG